jgi:nicotinamide-nucleotide amidase
MSDLAVRILDLARARGLRLATAESCTGGLVAGALTEIAGSSDVFECGYVTYSNQAKMRLLGVSQATLDRFGAVSEQTAREMALGALRDAKTDLAVSVTGIAGPGGSDHKPEGRVCFGLASKKGCATLTEEFGPLGRHAVRQASTKRALALFLHELET